jgi:hypothetical protein
VSSIPSTTSRGYCQRWAFGFIRIVQSRGPATDKGDVMRGLAELPWRPFAFGEVPPLAWEAIEGDELRASFNDGRTQAAVVFDVNRERRVLGGTESDRPRLVGKSVVETGWSESFGNYRMFDGVRIPNAAEAI